MEERPEFYFKKYMSLQRFWRIWSVLQLPDDPASEQFDENYNHEEDDCNEGVHPSYMKDGFHRIRGLFNAAISSW